MHKLFRTLAPLVGVLLLPIASLAQAISVRVNGDPVVFSGVGPQQISGHVLVPLRGVLEKLGAYVDYDAATKTVSANRNGIALTLRIGEQSATVNGRTVALDVPAQEFHGSTMVPLRFVGEALGAEVHWTAATYTVDIAMDAAQGPARDPNQYTPPRDRDRDGDRNVTITSFDLEKGGLMRRGSEIRVTLVGTPGGEATFSIPGVAEDVPLTEKARGTYEGTFRIPRDSRINISETRVVGRLAVGTHEKMIQAATTIGVDSEPPVITSYSPDNESRITRGRPNVSATFDDSSGSGVDPGSIEITVDDRNVTRDAEVTPTSVTYRPREVLAGGRHDVKVRATDRAGNPVGKSWSFQVVTNDQVIRSFKHDTGGQPLSPGTDVTFTLEGEPGGHASFSLGDRVTGHEMKEVTPGKYVGTYTIRRNDSFENTLVTAKLVTGSGETFTSEAADRFTIRGPLEPPTFTSPDNDAKVEKTVVFRGKAAPGSKVHIRIDYSKNPLGLLKLTGTVADLSVTANERGSWETDPIDMNTGLGGGSASFTVTATTIGSNGRNSEATVLKVRR